ERLPYFTISQIRRHQKVSLRACEILRGHGSSTYHRKTRDNDGCHAQKFVSAPQPSTTSMDWHGWLTQPEARILLRGNGIVGGTNLHGINRQYRIPNDEEGCEMTNKAANHVHNTRRRLLCPEGRDARFGAEINLEYGALDWKEAVGLALIGLA